MSLAVLEQRPLSGPGRQAPAKRRILETVLELFRAEGIRSVGVDRIIAASNVTKATFYKHYRSKDNLVLSYLDAVQQEVRETVQSLTAAAEDGAAAIRAIARHYGVEISDPGYPGCPFHVAAVEFGEPEHPVRLRVAVHRDWLTEQFELLLRGIGHPSPGDAADELLLAFDGAFSGGRAGDAIAASAALERAVERVLAQH